MKAFRTATTLCIADPTFNDVTRHRLLLPQGTPVQRELLTGMSIVSCYGSLWQPVLFMVVGNTGLPLQSIGIFHVFEVRKEISFPR